MVLEALINPKRVIGKPWEMISIGFVYSLVAAFLALWIFKNYVSIVMITLTVIAAIPFMHNVIKAEQQKGFSRLKEKNLLKEHSKAIFAFLYLFIGFVAAFTMLYIFMPSTLVERMFAAQLETIIAVKSTATGNFVAAATNLSTATGGFVTTTGSYLSTTGYSTVATGNYLSPFDALISIFTNNIRILVFCILFSFFYGAGAIFILTWNASVMAAAIGSFIRNNLFYAKTIFDYFQVTMVGLLQYLLHGIPEILAYFIGALASGMISVSLVNQDFMSKDFKNMLRDVGWLIAAAVGILLLSAFIEVFITPLLL